MAQLFIRWFVRGCLLQKSAYFWPHSEDQWEFSWCFVTWWIRLNRTHILNQPIRNRVPTVRISCDIDSLTWHGLDIMLNWPNLGTSGKYLITPCWLASISAALQCPLYVWTRAHFPNSGWKPSLLVGTLLRQIRLVRSRHGYFGSTTYRQNATTARPNSPNMLPKRSKIWSLGQVTKEQQNGGKGKIVST